LAHALGFAADFYREIPLLTGRRARATRVATEKLEGAPFHKTILEMGWEENGSGFVDILKFPA
jgi:hypothetical protein